jgi:dual-specificity kinase
MSTPQTLTQAPAPHYSLDYRQRHLISPNNQRYLPPPRPSSNLSNLSNGQYHNLPARPPSNISTSQQFAPPTRTQSGMSNGYSTQAHSQSQSRGGAEYPYANGLAQQPAHDDLRRRGSRASLHQRPYPEPAPASPSRAPPATAGAQMPPASDYDSVRGHSSENRRHRSRGEVDWVQYFGGKPPAEIITIHDDDSPAPPATTHKVQQPPQSSINDTYVPPAQHVDKRRRVTGAGNDVPAYGDSRTPYSYSNGTSTESLQNNTAPTSLGSSTSGKLEPSKVGEKRKRTTRGTEIERKKQETERLGPRGYLAEYGEYMPPPKQHKKLRDVAVPVLHDVRTMQSRITNSDKQLGTDYSQRYKNNDKIDDEDGHYIVQEGSSIANRYNLVNLLGQGTFGKVVRARDSKNKEFAVKIIRAVPKVLRRDTSHFESVQLTKISVS